MNYIVITVSVLLLAFLCWKEIKRPNRLRLFWRLLASCLAVISLAFLLLPFPWLQQAQRHPRGKTPPPADTLQAGIQAAFWQQQLTAGSTLRLQGRFKNSAAIPVKLLLSGFNERLDSVIIPAQQQQSFELRTRPRHTGRAVYTLTALTNDTIAKEPVPVEVLPLRPLKVLILAATPDFENRFLANWLSQHGYVVAQRTAISRNKYSYAFLDTARFQLERITPAVLSAFDLLISDAGALAALSREELGGLRVQVAEKGLGLILRADSSTGLRNFYDRAFQLMDAPDKNERPLVLQLVGNGTAGTLVTAPAAYLRPIPGIQALVWGPQQHIVAGSSLFGAGRLVLTTLSNTYTWLLSGRQEPYQSLWSLLLQQAARQRPLPDQWHTGITLPKVRQPVPLYLETARPLPLATVNTAGVSLAQDGVLPFRWQGTYWPLQAGWHTAAAPGGDSSWWYAFEQKDWATLDVQEAALTNRGITAGATGNTGSPPQIYFLIIFMLTVIFLWVEEKLV